MQVQHSHPYLASLTLGGDPTFRERLGGALFFCRLTHNVSDLRVETIARFINIAREALDDWKNLVGKMPAETEYEADLAHNNLRRRDNTIPKQIFESTEAFRSNVFVLITKPGDSPGQDKWKDVPAADYLCKNKFKKGLDRFEFMVTQFVAGARSVTPQRLAEWLEGMESELEKVKTVHAGLTKRL